MDIKQFKIEQEKLAKKYKPVCDTIENRGDLILYLEKEDNAYSRFILEKLLNPPTSKEASRQLHHIIPLGCGGPDEEWNRMSLEYEDHRLAHQIRFNTYGDITDELSIRMTGKVTEDEYKAALQKSLETRRLLKIGIHDVAVQSRSGRKGGTVWSEGKRDGIESRLSDGFKNAREKGMVWTHESGATVTIKPNEIQIPMDLVPVLDKVVPFTTSARVKGIPGSLNKVLSGTRQKALGWSVKVSS